MDIDIENMTYPVSLSGTCAQDFAFNNTFAWWEISGVTFPLTPLKCITSDECPPLPTPPTGMVSTWDGFSNATGDSFHYFCNMDGKRSKDDDKS